MANPPLLAVLKGQTVSPPPIWLMRQAGRYLPEYRALRAEKGGFLELVYDSPAAADITMQPLDRFGFDGAILFSDILIIPYAMGQDLRFAAGEGPILSPRLIDTGLETLSAATERLDAIYETVRLVRARLSEDKTLLGFAGSPWTVATYMLNGTGSKDQGEARLFAYQDPAAMQILINAIIDLTVEYLAGQIDAGADAVQIFDSWAGSLSPQQFGQWVIAPNAVLVEKLRAIRPDTPIIGFPKGAGAKLVDYARETGVDALGLDETIDPDWANTVLPEGLPVQGNFDPLLLQAGGEAMDAAAQRILTAFADRPHIFNLGHGIGQHTPIAHVEKLLTIIGKR